MLGCHDVAAARAAQAIAIFHARVRFPADFAIHAIPPRRNLPMTDAWLITACGYEPCRITGATRCRTRSGEPEIKIRVRGQRRHQWVHPFLVRNSADDARQLYTSAQQA
jgi:hypothetical protein